jgi:L-threonylcarbamoyladenylate synthase
MKTKIIKVSARGVKEKIIAEAAAIIRTGGLVAFPTETVYGLGANALDKKAVRKIFAAKSRPADNPLIVHIAKLRQLNELTADVPACAKKLIGAFWPGPLTLVFHKKSVVSDLITAQGSTVAVRMPNHPIARALIKAADVPIAAPSANRAGRPSATSAQDVFEDLGGKVQLILDAGRARFGLESTVVDVTGAEPVILRPGAVTKEALENVLKTPVRYASNLRGAARSPGMKYRHYAPKAKIIIISYKAPIKMAAQERLLIARLRRQKKRIGILATLPKILRRPAVDAVCFAGSTPNRAAKNLFHCLRRLDKEKVDIILAEGVPEQGLGAAIMNRLNKATASDSINTKKRERLAPREQGAGGAQRSAVSSKIPSSGVISFHPKRLCRRVPDGSS